MMMVYAADELAEGDRIMVGVDILTIDRVATGVVKCGPAKGVKWAHVYFPDGTSIGFSSDGVWHTTVLNAPDTSLVLAPDTSLVLAPDTHTTGT